jgi:hypothetical protein
MPVVLCVRQRERERNLVSHNKGSSWIEDVFDQGAKENIWTSEVGCGGKLENSA